MVGRAYRLRMRRKLKAQKRQASEISQETGHVFEVLFFRRLDRIVPISRFLGVWVGLLVLLAGIVVFQSQNLSSYYEFLKPVAGGVYREGVVGGFTTANPLYSTTTADNSVARLMYSGLFTYDQKGQLESDIAESWSVSESETEYTVLLKKDIQWHDGSALTADDVVFTYHTIQNPDAASPLFGSWQNIAIAKKDNYTVTFTLSNPLSSFLYSLTNGVIPKHILGSVPAGNLRTAAFNTVSPVGSGPFEWRNVEVRGHGDTREEVVSLVAHKNYYKGEPKLDGYVVRAIHNKDRLVKEFTDGNLTAVAGLDEVPADLQNDTAIRTYNFPLRAEVMTFFKTTEGILADAKVRNALVLATDRDEIISSLNYPALSVTGPFLRGQLGFDATVQQPGLDIEAAKKMLDEAGWLVGKNGTREKEGQELLISLYAADTPEFSKVALQLQNQWRAVGAKAELLLQTGKDLDATINGHAYDALLYGIVIGNDPDVYAYWDSSQADVRSMNRFNFSEYQSSIADEAIAAGRTRLDPELRAIKYKPFLQAWVADAPAVGLYQPRFLYVTRGPVHGLKEHTISTQTAYYAGIETWMIQRARVSE